MRKPNTKGKNNNTIWFKVGEKIIRKKYITVTIVILVVSYVASIFPASNSIGDVHEVLDHEFVQLYEDMPYSMNEGLVAQ